MRITPLLLLLIASSSFFAQTTITHLTIDSKYIKETRTLNITLPNGYQNSVKQYPLVLILDDGLLFNTTSAIVNQLSSTSRMPESIVVSLSASEKHRNYFAPNLYNNHRGRRYHYGNHQEAFINFLEFEVIPLIEKAFRIANFRMFIGFSPSSAIGLHTLLLQPNLFQAYICFAAGNIIGDGYHKDERLIEALATVYSQAGIEQSYLYVVSGDKDAVTQPYINTNIKDFNEKLSKFNTSSIHTKAETITGEGHTDVVLPGLITAFDFIFPKEEWIVDYRDLIEKEGAAKENITAFYQKLSDVYGFPIYPTVNRLYSMSCLKNIGRQLLRNNKVEEAIAIYEYWVTLYPLSHLAHYHLGLAFQEHQDHKNAITAFEKAYSLALQQERKASSIYKQAIDNLRHSNNN
ncbi:MAG: alpha/beta hydrolase-fold protein [Bacteroidota bacterium]